MQQRISQLVFCKRLILDFLCIQLAGLYDMHTGKLFCCMNKPVKNFSAVLKFSLFTCQIFLQQVFKHSVANYVFLLSHYNLA